MMKPARERCRKGSVSAYTARVARLARAIRISCAWALLASILACGNRPEAAPIAPARSSAIASLEGHLVAGRAYGDGPDGAAIAEALSRRYPDDAVAVRVIPGSPRVIVALLAFRDLRQITHAQREEFIDSFRSTLDLRFRGAEARMGIGLRGHLLYGAIGTREPGARALTVETGALVSPRPLEELLEVTEGTLSTEPAITLGETIAGTFDASDDFGNRRWVLEVDAPVTIYLRGRRADGQTDAGRNGVWTGVCPGNTFNSDCQSLKNEDSNEASLAPGTYSVFAGIAPGCDTDATPQCWRVATPYEIWLADAEVAAPR